MKVKVVNDNNGMAERRVEAIQRIKGIDAVQKVWENSIPSICNQIEPTDIVVLDVNLGPLGRYGGLDVFLELLRMGYFDAAKNQLKISVIFDSGEPCRGKLESQFSISGAPLNLHQFQALCQACQIVFAHEEFSEDIVKSVRKALGFSFQDTRQMLFNPFLCLHVAVQHIQMNEEPNPQTFMKMEKVDAYARLSRHQKDAENYYKDFLTPYAQRLGCGEQLAPIHQFLNGALAKLCKVLKEKTAPDERLAEVKSLVSAGGDCADFLSEFQGAVDAVSAIATYK
ncbi:MAG: hypothetical protein ACE5PV_23165 [Candidatus Poribacteria bacterium]